MGSAIWQAKTACPNLRSRKEELLDFDSGARVDELLLDRLGFFLADAFLDRLGSAVDQVLGLFQAEAGDFANGLDDVDLFGPPLNVNSGWVFA